MGHKRNSKLNNLTLVFQAFKRPMVKSLLRRIADAIWTNEIVFIIKPLFPFVKTRD